MQAPPSLPSRIPGIDVPRDDVSRGVWRWAERALPGYLLRHSVRSYCWGAVIAAGEGWSFDRRVLWTASLVHDAGLRRVASNTMCFEVEGAEFARRLLDRLGMRADEADRVAIAIILHMQPAVTLQDGVEAVLLDRATGLDVRGAGLPLVEGVRDRVLAAFPRGDFDRRFLAAIRREAALRPTCQSARLLRETGLADAVRRSAWPIGS